MLEGKTMGGIKNSIENLSPLAVSVIYAIVTLFCPIAVVTLGWGGDSEGNKWVDLVVVALTWTFFPLSGNSHPMGLGIEGYGIYFLNPSVLINTFPILFLSIVFAVQVVRFRMGEAPRKQTLQLGFLSILPATLWGLLGYTVVVQSGLFIYVGPIPIQLLLGYLFMRYSLKWKTEQLFEDEKVENWWERQGSE
jgi:hypothetical protein